MSTVTRLARLDEMSRSSVGCALHVRTQVAFVRALADEVGREHEPNVNVAELFEQLEEETRRLERMLGRTGPRDVNSKW